MTLHYSRTVEAQASGGRYPEDVADEFLTAAREVAAATEGWRLCEVTVGGDQAAVLVPPGLVEYALRHGWGR